MFLKNYTSEVPVTASVARIRKVLIECGVSGITEQFGPQPGTIAAIIFHIEVGGQQCRIRLAPEVEKCRNALWKDYVGTDKLELDGTMVARPSKKKKCRKDFDQQAARTAWRLVQEEVEIQMSKIQLGQADFRQAFLAQIWDGTQTVWQRLEERNFAGLLPSKASDTH